MKQQGLYSAKDIVSASWLHESEISGSVSWNCGSFIREDIVEIYGSKGKIVFSVFDDILLQLTKDESETNLIVVHPENIQLYHV